MANRLKMAEIDKILTLRASGHSNRAIADLCGPRSEARSASTLP